LPVELGEFRIEIETKVENVEYVGCERANDDSEEWKACDTALEVVDVAEDERECLKPEIENGVSDYSTSARKPSRTIAKE